MARLGSRLVCLSALALLSFSVRRVDADSIETQSSPVDNGTITIDADRSDWNGVPEFAADTDTVAPGPELDFDLLQMANDASNLFFRIRLLPSPSGEPQPFGFRHNLFLDTDQNRETGFLGGGSFLPIGSDYLVQGPAVFEFAGTTQEEFAWSFLQDVTADDVPDTDVEAAVSLAGIGSPDQFDFFLNAANSDFAAEDFYPEFANSPLGDFFTYEVAEVVAPEVEGDYNASGLVEQADLDLVLTNWGADGSTPPAGWDNDLPQGFIDQGELDGVLSNWGSSAAVAVVPEPASFWLLLGGGLSVWGILRHRAVPLRP
jgi:hypothetical protein